MNTRTARPNGAPSSPGRVAPRPRTMGGPPSPVSSKRQDGREVRRSLAGVLSSTGGAHVTSRSDDDERGSPGSPVAHSPSAEEKLEKLGDGRGLFHVIEQLAALEGALWSILDGLKSNATHVSFFCREYWGTSASHAQLSLEKLGFHERLKRQAARLARTRRSRWFLRWMSDRYWVQQACVLESLSLGVASHLCSGTMQGVSVTIRSRLRNLLYYVHENCLVLLDLVCQRWLSEQSWRSAEPYGHCADLGFTGWKPPYQFVITISSSWDQRPNWPAVVRWGPPLVLVLDTVRLRMSAHGAVIRPMRICHPGANNVPSLPTADSTTVSAPAAQAAPPEFGDTGTSTTPAEHEDLFGDGSLISFGIPLEDRQAKRELFPHPLYCEFVDGKLQRWRPSRFNKRSLLSIPASGYMGALYHNRQLTCCFCSCNLFLAVLSIASFTRLVIRLFEVNGNCDLESDDSQRALCEMWLDRAV
eukprot:g31462.t1